MQQKEIVNVLQKNYNETGELDMILTTEKKEQRSTLTALRHLVVKGTIDGFWVIDETNIQIIGFNAP